MALADQLAQGVQFAAPPDPFAQYAKMQQLQQGQQQLQATQTQNQVSQMQLEDLKRDREGMVQFQQDLAAKGGNPDLNTYADMMLRSNNAAHQKMGLELKQKLLEQQKFSSIMGVPSLTAPAAAAPGATAPAAAPTMPASAPMQAGALGSGTFGMAPEPRPAPVNALAPAPTPSANALAPTTGNFAPNPAAANVDDLRAKRDKLLSMGTTQSIAAAKAIDADIAIASREQIYHNVPGVGLVDPRTGRVVTASVESTQPDIKQYEYAKAQGDPRSFFQFKSDLAKAGRTPAQERAEPAPTVATIQDPTNPNQMISINARDYRGGGIGSPGVIGLTGKTPAATAKQDVVDKGVAQVATTIDDLRASYDKLNAAAAIPSTQRGVLSNLAASAQASGLGQALGRQRNNLLEIR